MISNIGRYGVNCILKRKNVSYKNRFICNYSQNIKTPCNDKLATKI